MCKFEGVSSLLCMNSCDNANKGKGHYHCPNCTYTNKDKKRLKTHVAKHKIIKQNTFSNSNKQKKEKSHSITIDPEQGLFMVSMKLTGDQIPIHVIAQKNPKDDSIKYECSIQSCQEAMKLTWVNGCPQYLCHHVSRIIPETHNKSRNWIYDEVDMSLLSEKEKDMLTASRQD